METKENRAPVVAGSAVGHKDLAGSGSKATLNANKQQNQDVSGDAAIDREVDGEREVDEAGDRASSGDREVRSGEFWLHVRERDDKEFYFSTEPTTIPTLHVTVIAAGVVQTKTKSLVWLPSGSVTTPPTLVQPRGRRWKLHSTAEDHSVWRRNTQRRKYVLHDGVKATEIVYPPARVRPEQELGA